MRVEDNIHGRDPEERPSQLVSGADLSLIVALMKELRETTQSRGTFAAANDLLARFGGETDLPSLVAEDMTEH
jgi:hypothetical protein